MDIQYIYWFAYYNPTEPSVRYRAQFPLQYLRDNYGIEYSIVYPGYDFQSIRNFILTYFSALLFRKRNSVIVFQKIYTEGIYAAALKVLLFFRPQYTLYDIDDAEYTRRPVKTLQYFMRNCSACSAGSNSIVNYIRPLNTNVFLLTSPVLDHGITKKTVEEHLTIGWIGYYGAHRNSLTRLFFPALLKIDFPVTLKLLGVSNEMEVEEITYWFRDNKNISVETPLNLDWLNEYSIYKIISTFDVGISPLLDTEFNRGKSAFKLKQCMSCGIPVLGSSVGENTTFLKDGINGYICNNPNEYYHKIKSFSNRQNRHYSELSKNAQNTFPQFSMDLYCSVFLEFFKSNKHPG